jgi:thiamine-monophosphate kinase
MGISDFAAKGVRPQVAVVAVGLPRGLSRRAVREIALGLRDAATYYGIKILGGDTNEAENLTITPALFGLCPRRDVISRIGAKCGDLLVVSGLFGNTSAGLKIIQGKFETSSAERRKIIKSVYKPMANLDLGLKLKTFGATAAIDSSDGLAWSLYELSRASHVGFEVNILPITPEAKNFAVMNHLDPFDLVFYGGEEYELVATVKPEVYKASDMRHRNQLIPIGRVVKGSCLTYLGEDGKKRILPHGWEHFKTSLKIQ